VVMNGGGETHPSDKSVNESFDDEVKVKLATLQLADNPKLRQHAIKWHQLLQSTCYSQATKDRPSLSTSWSLLGPGVEVGLTPSFIDLVRLSLK
jgi:hypothetical protein